MTTPQEIHKALVEWAEARKMAVTNDNASWTRLSRAESVLERLSRAAMPPAQPVTVAQAAQVLENELGLAFILKKCDGDQAHRIMPNIWPVLCKYVALTEQQEEDSPLRCAECDCENGGADCTWIARQEDDPLPCPVCGCEDFSNAGYLRCECPAPIRKDAQ